jgi:hypothetical protein
LDHVVHINNGNGAAKPIVLRLLPGEETIFNLKIVNHGKPSDISLQASSPVIKAVRLKKPDHYVVTDEIIPVLVRMPADKKRLNGEILLSGSSGECLVPITLLRDSEDPGDDLEDPGPQGDEGLLDDLRGCDPEKVDASDEDAGEETEECAGEENDDEDEDGNENGEKAKEPRRIAFSRDQDLQRYRSATSRKRAARAAEICRDKCDLESEVESIAEDHDSRQEARFNARIDNRFVDPINRQNERQRPASGYEESRRDFSSDPDNAGQEIITTPEREERELGRERGRERERAPEELERPVESVKPEEYFEQDEEPLSFGLLDKLGGFEAFSARKVVPAVLFLALAIVLVMTFIMQSIPEFPGALGSSILIVTLIIYGAATLLKA